MHDQMSAILAGAGVSAPVPGCGRTIRFAVVTGLAGLLAAACGDDGGGTIACESATDCPLELFCDIDRGICVDGDGGDFDCQPPLPGCVCDDGDDPAECLLEGQNEDVIGSCSQGQTFCVDGVYAACEETGSPYCDHVDVDEDDLDVDDDNSDQVTESPDGGLILDPDVKQVEFGFVWVANTGENTVSKLDVDTGDEVGRFASVRDSGSLGVPTVPIGGFDGDEDQGNCGNCPSRTAIDFKGDAFVANRAFGIQGTITKYANSDEDCIDRNGNGVIDTTFDVDGDGRIDVTDPGEFLGEDDECILWTVPVGNGGGIPRGLAIDAGGPDGENGNVWVGLYGEQRVVQISGDTGAPIQLGGGPVSVAVPGQSPYGLAVDGTGVLWVTGIEDNDLNYLSKVNTFQAVLVEMYAVPDDDDGCSRGYGIAVDIEQRIWLGGYECNDVKMFDQDTEEWHRADYDDVDFSRGVAVDKEGYVWIAFHNSGVGKVLADDIINMGDAAPLQMFTLPQAPGISGPVDNTIGVGIDRNGACWAVSRNDDAEAGTATRIDPDDTVTSFAVGRNPYTYSDFTGFGLSQVVRPNGFWRGLIEGCATEDGVTIWRSLDWEEEEPPGTTIRLRVRTANTIADIDTALWFGPFDDPPVDLMAAGVPPGHFLQIEVQFSTDDPEVTPTFRGFSVAFQCPGAPPIE